MLGQEAHEKFYTKEPYRLAQDRNLLNLVRFLQKFQKNWVVASWKIHSIILLSENARFWIIASIKEQAYSIHIYFLLK